VKSVIVHKCYQASECFLGVYSASLYK